MSTTFKGVTWKHAESLVEMLITKQALINISCIIFVVIIVMPIPVGAYVRFFFLKRLRFSHVCKMNTTFGKLTDYSLLRFFQFPIFKCNIT